MGLLGVVCAKPFLNLVKATITPARGGSTFPIVQEKQRSSCLHNRNKDQILKGATTDVQSIRSRYEQAAAQPGPSGLCAPAADTREGGSVEMLPFYDHSQASDR